LEDLRAPMIAKIEFTGHLGFDTSGGFDTGGPLS
jgi:hypothetical protein